MGVGEGGLVKGRLRETGKRRAKEDGGRHRDKSVGFGGHRENTRRGNTRKENTRRGNIRRETPPPPPTYI